jgi:hypothetical protein
MKPRIAAKGLYRIAATRVTYCNVSQCNTYLLDLLKTAEHNSFYALSHRRLLRLETCSSITPLDEVTSELTVVKCVREEFILEVLIY